jgi:hypothetical protein
VVAATSLSFPIQSDEAFAQISTVLAPGWYGLIFGSGRLNTFGWGGTVNTGVDIGAPSYIVWQPGEGWFNLADLGFPGLGNLRLVVEGALVPEPSSSLLFAMAATLLFTRRR